MINGFNKIFSIKEEGLHYVVNILGIKIRLRSLKLAYKKIKELESKQYKIKFGIYHKSFMKW